MSVVPLAELKAHLDIPAGRTVSDAELQGMLDAAEEWVSEYIRRPIGGGSYTYALYGQDGLIVLPTTRAVAVTAVTDATGSAVTVDAAASILPAGLVRLSSKVSGVFTVTVTFPVAVSPSVLLATLIVAGHLWETQRGTAPTPLSQQEPSGSDFPIPGAGYAIPNRARDLLASYVAPPAVA